jgi:hypothetical protein
MNNINEVILPRKVLEEALANADKTSTVIIITEYDDETANIAYSQMPPRDLWWQLTNACMRVWHMIGGV